MGVRGSIWFKDFIVGSGGPGGASGPCAWMEQTERRNAADGKVRIFITFLFTVFWQM